MEIANSQSQQRIGQNHAQKAKLLQLQVYKSIQIKSKIHYFNFNGSCRKIKSKSKS